jgi:hypothetical protein
MWYIWRIAPFRTVNLSFFNSLALLNNSVCMDETIASRFPNVPAVFVWMKP